MNDTDYIKYRLLENKSGLKSIDRDKYEIVNQENLTSTELADFQENLDLYLKRHFDQLRFEYACGISGTDSTIKRFGIDETIRRAKLFDQIVNYPEYTIDPKHKEELPAVYIAWGNAASQKATSEYELRTSVAHIMEKGLALFPNDPDLKRIYNSYSN